jgi:hypothetical protein
MLRDVHSIKPGLDAEAAREPPYILRRISITGSAASELLPMKKLSSQMIAVLGV